jgi:hypothetical protein
MPSRFVPLLRQRLFTTSTRARNTMSLGDAAVEQLEATAKAVPKLGRVARWYVFHLTTTLTNPF